MKNVLKHLVILGLYTALTCLLLAPLPGHLATGILEAQSGDPLLQIWVVQWNIHKLTTSLAHYFDANIFYPYPNTFAYHDHMFALGLLGLPMYLLTHNPILTYNALLLCAFIFTAYGMYLFCREITRNEFAAFLAGAIFGFLPYRFAHLDHLNLLSIQWLPVCLLFLGRAFSPTPETPAVETFRRNVSPIALFWFFFLLQAWTSFNYLFMLAFTVGIYLVTTLLLQWRQAGVQTFVGNKPKFALLLLGGCLVGLLLLPLIVPYLKANREMGFQRTLTEAASLSARVQDYFVAPENNWLYGQFTRRFQSPNSPFPGEQMLFYGLLPMLLAMIGSWGGTPLRRIYLILFMAAGMLSFGPAATFLGKSVPLPYAWFYYLIPGLKSMRVPARFGLLAAFALTVLAAIGAARIFTYVKQGTRFGDKAWPAFVITGLLGGIILSEYYSRPKSLSFYPGTPAAIPAVYQWLAQHPEADRLIELPVRSAKDDFEATYYATFHWKRLVNGRSAFIPTGIAQILEEMRNFPTLRTVALLRSLGVQYALVHTAKCTPPFPVNLPAGLVLRQTFAQDLLLEIWPQTPAISAPTIVQYHLPATLRPAEQYTLGIFINSASAADWSPLPQEKIVWQLTWQTGGRQVAQELREITLPIFIPAGEQLAFPLPITTPPQRGDYQLVLAAQTTLFEPNVFTKRITLAPEMLDSRRPGKLQAEFLRVDAPAVWEHGQPLRVRALVKNNGDTLWKARAVDRKQPVGEVHLGVWDWQEVSTGASLQKSQPQLFQSRGFLPYDVAPGEEVSLIMDLRTPDATGEFLLRIDLVSELIQWFSAQGSPVVTKKIILK